MTVLVVEDDPALSGLLQAVLRRSGFTVEVIPRGDHALAALQCGADRYETVLLDLMLPGLSGFEILEFLHERNPHLLRRVIVLSAASSVVLETLPFASSIWRLVRKPFDLRELLDIVLACVTAGTTAPVERPIDA